MFSDLVMSDSLRPHGLQHVRLPCPSLSPWVCWNSWRLSQWCHPTISSSVVPILFLPSLFPSIRGFSNELALHIRWPKYWSFSISLSNEYSGLFSFRINWFDLLVFQGTFKSLLQHSLKASILWCSGFPWWLRWWRICLQCKRLSLDPWVGKIPWRREWLRNQYSCLENSIDRQA